MRDSLVEHFQSDLSDRYAFERELGRGGMSVVYLARDKKHERSVAVKVLSPDFTTPLGTERFLREVRITAQLQHPHILTLIDSGTAAGLCYFVMPFVEGETLRDRLTFRRQLPVLEAFRTTREVASALAYAHDKGIVHRDIKPENILLASGQAMVADFGVARAMDEARGTALTMGGLAVGTPAYMSPEQASGQQDVDGRSDVYSLGCVLYEMLAGRPPFTGPTAESVIRQQVEAEPVPLATFRKDLSEDILALVEKALRKDPEERFASAAEMQDALRLHVAGEVLHHRTPGAGQKGMSDPDTPVPLAMPGLRGIFSTTTAESSVGLTRHRKRLALAGSLAFVVIVLFLGLTRKSGSARPALGQGFLASIAAMPLDSYGTDTESAMLSEGLTEELIARLSMVKGLKVISRTSVVAVKQRKLTVPEIAKELKVRHVLEGSVQRSGTRIRVTLQLVDARTDAHVWAESYERELTDIFTLREEIAAKVTAAIVEAVPEVRADAAPPTSKTSMCSVYDSVLAGKYWLERPTPQGIKGAVTAFEDAIKEDPKYAPGYAGLSTVLRMSVQLGYRDGVDPWRDWTRAVQLANKAVKLDPRLAEAYAARSAASLFGWGPVADAVEDVQHGLRLQPGSGELVALQALALARQGKDAESLEKLQVGLELNPFCPFFRGLVFGSSMLSAGKPEVALRLSRQAADLEPAFPLPRLIEALSLYAMGRSEECLRVDLTLFPEARAMCLAGVGRAAEAAELMAGIEARYRAGNFVSTLQPGYVTTYHAAIGDVPGTVEWLERTFAATPAGIDFRILKSSLFERVRKDPRFTAAIERAQDAVRAKVYGVPAA